MQKEQLITCPKCHGKGTYEVPMFDDETFMPSKSEWEQRPCEVCHGTGKITLQFYEEVQRKCREK